MSCIISGIPGHDIEDVVLKDIRIWTAGGGTAKQAATRPAEKESTYPEPGMFGDMPAYGFFIRHVKGIELNNVQVTPIKPDQRPPIVLNDVKDADFYRVKAPRADGVPFATLKDVQQLGVSQCPGVPDTRKDAAADGRL